MCRGLHHREHGWGSPTSHILLFTCKCIRCVWLCAGGLWGTLYAEAKVWEFLSVVLWVLLGAPANKIQQQHGVYCSQYSNSAVVCTAMHMISELGREASQIQCKCHKQLRSWDEYCATFVLLIFEFPLQLDLQNTFIILVCWWMYCLPDLHKNWLQERLIPGYKRTKSFP